MPHKFKKGDTDIHLQAGTLVYGGVMAGGKKYDDGKAPVMQGLFQFFPRALKEVALHSAYGAKKYEEKYEDKNWSKVENGKNRYGDALSRHILDQFIDGPIDPESERLHACAMAWNALAYLEKVIEETDND